MYTSSNTLSQIKITSQVPNLMNILKTKYNLCIKYRWEYTNIQIHIPHTDGNIQIQILLIHFSFYIHDFKLKAEVLVDLTSVLVIELNKRFLGLLCFHHIISIWPSHVDGFSFQEPMHVLKETFLYKRKRLIYWK